MTTLEDGYSGMNDVVYQVEHSVDAPVSPAFAWDCRTDVKNWDDPPAQFQLDGPFAAGSWARKWCQPLMPPAAPSRRKWCPFISIG